MKTHRNANANLQDFLDDSIKTPANAQERAKKKAQKYVKADLHRLRGNIHDHNDYYQD